MKTSFFLVVSFAIVFLENSILNYIDILGVSIDFLLVYICLISISIDKRTALIVAVASGLLRDVLVEDIIGLNALIMYTVSYTYSQIKDKIFRESRFTVIMLILFASTVESIFKVIFYKEYVNGTIYITVFDNFLIFPIINSLAGVAAYKIFVRTSEKFKKATSLY